MPTTSPSVTASPVGRAGSGPRPALLSDREFEDWYRSLFAPLVSRVAWRFGLSREDACDIVQDAFTLALIKLDPSGNPKAWLIGVVDYLAVNYRRKTKRRADLLSRWSSPFSEVGG